MRIIHLALVALLWPQFPAFAQTTTMELKDLQEGPYRHRELSPALLERIRATTDVFHPIDGLSYEQAVDLYKRDLNPEENVVLWEEMARVYTTFCKGRCTTAAERMDVYQALLLRSMFDEQDAIRKAAPKVLTAAEVTSVVKSYRLPAKPISVVKSQ